MINDYKSFVMSKIIKTFPSLSANQKVRVQLIITPTSKMFSFDYISAKQFDIITIVKYTKVTIIFKTEISQNIEVKVEGDISLLDYNITDDTRSVSREVARKYWKLLASKGFVMVD